MATRADVKTEVPQRFSRGPVVYFIGGADGLVKIGFTTELPNRLRNLRNSSPVPLGLLAAVAGTRELEAVYHKRFQADRRHGEWFERSEAIKEEIATLIWMPRVMFKFKSYREGVAT